MSRDSYIVTLPKDSLRISQLNGTPRLLVDEAAQYCIQFDFKNYCQNLWTSLGVFVVVLSAFSCVPQKKLTWQEES